MRRAQEELMERCRKWVKRNECGFPLDLTTDLINAGMDAGVIEDKLLNGQQEA